MSRADTATKTVAVIGRDGQVARALQMALPGFGFRVVTFARPEFDLATPSALERAISDARPDVVINAAAYTAVDKAEDEPELAHAINAVAPGVISAAAAAVGCPIVHFSTDYVFDGSKAAPYLETDAVAPLGVYGASKLAGEQLVAAANARHIILRTAWVCSPFGQNFVKTMLRFGAERPVLKVVNDQHGAPTFADDIARAAGTMVSQLTSGAPEVAGPRFGVFNLTSVGVTTWFDFAVAIMAGAEARGRTMAAVEPIPTSGYPTKARRPQYSKLDTQKIKTVYGVDMPPWQESLERCLDTLVGPTRT
jgi:dTDP-4-dehydrorhamnose reductase